MAYGLKYTQYLEKGGAQLQIRVYAKDWNGASYGMAHVTGASLQIIGGQSDVLTPYIKTAFSWSLADAWDQGATKADGTTCVNAANEKCGKWEEFYTPDATKFRVELWTKATPSATAVCIWKGYVTPDSWSENMIYRGSVTITARDMLGALQDKEFNLTGRVSVLDVIQGALAACECPMELDYTAAHFLVNENGTSILQHTFAASTFSGDNWQTVLQETLESLGLVLRYNGAGKIILTSLRYLAADTLSGSHGIEFISRTGLRELDPALKLITETFDVNFVAYNAQDPAASQFARNGGTITCSLGQRSGKLYAYTLTRQDGEGWAGGLAIPLYGTIGPGVQSRGMFFPTNAVTTGTTDIPEADYINPRLQRSFRFAIKQDGPLVLASGINVCDTFSAYNGAGYGIDQIGLRIEAVSSGGSTKYLNDNGVWADEISYRYVSLDEEVEVPDFGVAQGETFYYRIVLKDVSTAAATDNMRGLAPLLAALLLEVSPNTNSTVATEYKTTTVYNEDNNVTITRRPKIGCAAGAVDGCIDFYENVLALGQAIVADHWNWPGESSYYPLAVMIQAQALCFHAAAASVFTGTLHDKATPEALAFPGCAYTYYERSCVPISGTFDFTSGFVAQTFIREVYSWEEVWGTFAPDYTQISGSGKGSTSATGSGGSSVSPGGGGGGGGGSTARSFFEEDLEDPGRINLKEQYDAVWAPDFLIGNSAASLYVAVGTFAEGIAENAARIAGLEDRLNNPSFAELYVGMMNTEEANIGGVRLYWDAERGALRIEGDIITDGDQIVIDGTPGGGSGIGYLYEAYDVSQSISGKPSARKMLVFDPSGTDKNGDPGAWVYEDIPTESISSVSLAQGASGKLHLVVNGTAQSDVAVPGLGTAAFANADTFAAAVHSHTVSQITDFPSTWAWSAISDKPSNLSGYGITDGVNDVEVTGTGNAVTAASISGHKLTLTKGTTFLTGNQTITLSGDVSGSGTTSIAVSIGAGKVTNTMLAGSIAWSKLSVGASDIVTTLGSTPVNRATADASGNNIASTYQTISDTQAMELSLSEGISSNDARITSLEDWLNNPSFAEFYCALANVDVMNVGGILIYWDGEVGALRIDGDIVTNGDQIVLDGTPGGGGGGGAGYLYELGDVYSNDDKVLRANGSERVAGDLLAFDSTHGWVAFAQSSLGIAISQVAGLQTALDNKVNNSAISDMATKTWVNQQGFVTSSGVTNIATGTGLSGGPITSTGTISISSTYQTYISHGETAYGWGNHASAGYASAADVLAVELALSEGVADNAARITSLEDWLANPSFAELYAGLLNADEINIGGSIFAGIEGVAQWDGSAFFSSLSSNGATITAVVGGQSRSQTLTSIPNSSLTNSAITINGTATSLGGSFSTGNITAGTAGQSSASSGTSFSIPYVTMNKYGIVTGYGTHTHTISAAELVSTLGTTPVNRATADASGNTITSTYQTKTDTAAIELTLAEGIAENAARLAALEAWLNAPALAEMSVTLLNVEYINLGGIIVRYDPSTGALYAEGDLITTGDQILV